MQADHPTRPTREAPPLVSARCLTSAPRLATTNGLDYGDHAEKHLTDYGDLLPTSLRISTTPPLVDDDVNNPKREQISAVPKTSDSDLAWKQINYFKNNQERMDSTVASTHPPSFPCSSVGRAGGC